MPILQMEKQRLSKINSLTQVHSVRERCIWNANLFMSEAKALSDYMCALTASQNQRVRELYKVLLYFIFSRWVSVIL